MNFMEDFGSGVFRLAGTAAIALAMCLATWSFLADPNNIGRRYWAIHVANLDRQLRSMFIWTPGKHIAYGQAAGIGLVLIAALVIHLPFWWAIVALIALGPSYQIKKMRKKRIAKIDEQLDGFMNGLANALKSIPSISSAFVSVQPVLQAPIRDEVELAIKEMRVGSTLDQALLNMSARVGSRNLDSAFSAILVGRQIGGNLPQILETTANTLREMGRLEGVIRSKTAEGKAQLWVLAFTPFMMIITLNTFSPGYFDALQESIFGYLVAIVAGLFWLGSLLVARKVLAVDI